mmetsp:Transcript_2043/g.4750  ORF Transcript_2043/g.4750 Transcript_2043/m.4750 type:complete len:273 (-) Transcript_2043:120-938(-)
MANKVGGVVVTPPSAGDANKIVVLLGWMGSTDRQLSTYSALYEQRGCTTVRFIAPGSAALCFHSTLKKQVEQVLQDTSQVFVKAKSSAKIYVHLFSNNGTFAFIAMLQRFQQPDSPFKPVVDAIHGTVFDSCPQDICYGRLEALPSLYGAVQKSIVGASKSIIKTVVSHLAASSVVLGVMVATILSPVIGASPILRDFWSTLRDSPLRCPETMIYSADDQLISFKHVERLADEREQQGIKVTRVRLESSPHVAHLITDTNLYTKTIDAVLQA